MPPRIPSLRRHKPSEQGVVTLGGRDVYLGPWPSTKREPPADIQSAYDAKIAEWLAGGRVAEDGPAEPLTVSQLFEAFWTHAQQHYRDGEGKATNEQSEYKLAMRPVRHLYAELPAADFSPLKIKAVRHLMVSGYKHPKYGDQPALARKVVNQRVGRIVRIWKWAVAEELAPETVYRALRAVRGLEKGRTEARETEAVTPVAEELVYATLPHLLPVVQAMVRLQMLTGMRQGEVCVMRGCDIDTSGAVWVYKPKQHKTAHCGKVRTIALGPKAQAVLRPWLRLELEAFLFSPAEALQALQAEKRTKRKTRVQPSQQDRSRKKPKRKPGNRYTPRSYYRAIFRACDRMNAIAIEEARAAGQDVEDGAVLVAHWHPHQLRHTHATTVRKRFGLEAAQVALGHTSADITQVYAERDLALAITVASQIG